MNSRAQKSVAPRLCGSGCKMSNTRVVVVVDNSSSLKVFGNKKYVLVLEFYNSFLRVLSHASKNSIPKEYLVYTT